MASGLRQRRDSTGRAKAEAPGQGADSDLGDLLADIRRCRLCAPALPHEPRPVVRLGAHARLLVVGQAPGRRVHETGLPWNDASGRRLRQWLAMDEVQFYDTRQVAIAATGLCYPGTVDGADLPPRPECALRWQARIRAALPELRLVLLVGAHAQVFHLGERRMSTLAQTVHAWERYLPEYFPLPHPSWRTTAWLARHPWFAEALLPALRERVRAALA